MMKKFLILAVCALLLANVNEAFAQSNSNDEVALVVSSEGNTEEEAMKSALITAVSSVYQKYISKDISLLDDAGIRDEIISKDVGNVKKYRILSSERISEDKYYVTLRATVSVVNLFSYAQANGYKTEFAGNSFAFNIMKRELDKENEKRVVTDMIRQVQEVFPSSFSYKLDIGDPKYYQPDPNYYKTDFSISIIPNDLLEKVNSLIENTLVEISLSNEEKMEYEGANEPFYDLYVRCNSAGYDYSAMNNYESYACFRNTVLEDDEVLYFRSEKTVSELMDLNMYFAQQFLNFELVDNDDEESFMSIWSFYYDRGSIYNDCYIQPLKGEGLFSRYVRDVRNEHFDYKIDAKSLNVVTKPFGLVTISALMRKDNIDSYTGFQIHRRPDVEGARLVPR